MMSSVLREDQWNNALFIDYPMSTDQKKSFVWPRKRVESNSGRAFQFVSDFIHYFIIIKKSSRLARQFDICIYQLFV